MFNTVDTTRVDADSPIAMSILVSTMNFPSSQVPWRPSSVVLVPDNPYPFSYIGASIVHFPINASFLYTNTNYLPSTVFMEIDRLSPTGKNVPAQVFLIGPISRQVEATLNQYGYSTMRIGSNDVFETAAYAAYFRLEEIPPKAKIENHIIIASAEQGEEVLSAPYYSAHQGTPIVFVTRDAIPEATKWVLERFSNYTFTIFGTERTISKSVENKIRAMVANVDRIEGSNPIELSVNFSKRPHNVNQLGWDRREPGKGNAFSFGTINSWQKTIAGCLFAHIGKHTPLLIIEPNHVPRVVRDYLLELNPKIPSPPAPPFMHGFVLGNFYDISYSAQVELEENLILRAKESWVDE